MSLIIPAIVSLFMLIADQVTKAAVVAYFAGSAREVSVIPGVLSFCHVENDGAGFSILSGNTWFLIIFTTLAMALVAYMLLSRKFKSKLSDWGFMLILSGGLGNFIDRIARKGLVVDFIKTDFMDFPVFNVADICVTIGAAFIMLYFLLDTIKEYKLKKGSGDNGEA